MRIDKTRADQVVAVIDRPGLWKLRPQGIGRADGNDAPVLDGDRAAPFMARGLNPLGERVAVKAKGLTQKQFHGGFPDSAGQG